MLAACMASCTAFPLALSSCNGAADGRKTIGVSLLTKEHIFYQNLLKSLESEAAAKNFRLIVTAGDWDLAKQQSQIENFIVQKVDAMVVCPVNSKAIGPSIERANAANIPVFTADIRAESGKVVTHVGSDNFQGGQLAGEYIAKALNGKGKVGVIEQPIVESALQRTLGFEDAIKKYPDVQIVSKLNGDGVRDRSMKAAEDLLQGFSDVQAIFAINDPSALGVLAALQSRGRNDIIVVGFDGDPEAISLLEKGSALKADIEQHPDEIGRSVIDAIDKHLKGESVPEAIPVKVTIREAAK